MNDLYGKVRSVLFCICQGTAAFLEGGRDVEKTGVAGSAVNVRAEPICTRVVIIGNSEYSTCRITAVDRELDLIGKWLACIDV